MKCLAIKIFAWNFLQLPFQNMSLQLYALLLYKNLSWHSFWYYNSKPIPSKCSISIALDSCFDGSVFGWTFAFHNTPCKTTGMILGKEIKVFININQSMFIVKFIEVKHTHKKLSERKEIVDVFIPVIWYTIYPQRQVIN